jgi:nitrogen regulatory protein P-II 1
LKKIEAIIRTEKLEIIKDQLSKFGIRGMTVYPVMGCGNQKGWTEVYRGNEYFINLLPKVKIEIAVTDNQAEKLVKLISEVARTGEIGDGKIFVVNLEDVIRVRTGERGEKAL